MIAPSLYNRPYHNMDAEYSVLISDVEATIPIYPEYTYYSTWDSAITDANNGTVGKNADATAESAVSCVYVDGNQIANVVLLRDAETAGMEIAKDMVINLNGHKLSMTNGNLSSAIRHTNGHLVVDGSKTGSIIEATNSEKNTQCINVRGGSLTVNGGTYIARAGAAKKEARTIQIYPGLKATLTDCDIFAYGAENGLVGGVFNYGTATLTNCRVEAYGEYNSSNNKRPKGIYSDGPLTLNNCYAYGAHSAVHVSDTTVINGGTYESPGHGGIYVFCTNKTVHIRNATVRYCDIKAGDTYIAGAIGPGMYIGGGSGKDYITVYMDNCVISSKEGEPQIVLRGTADEHEHDNNLYISNSTLLGEKFYIRIDNLTHKLYLGAGNNFNTENTTIKALYDPNSMLPCVIETDEIYDTIY